VKAKVLKALGHEKTFKESIFIIYWQFNFSSEKNCE